PVQFKKLVFGLNFFHSILWVRRNYDVIGWNNCYGWNNLDHGLAIESIRQLLNISDEKNEDVPFGALHYLTSHVHYGSHIRNEMDQKCLNNLLSDIFTPSIMDDKYVYTVKDGYHYTSESGTNL